MTLIWGHPISFSGRTSGKVRQSRLRACAQNTNPLGAWEFDATSSRRGGGYVRTSFYPPIPSMHRLTNDGAGLLVGLVPGIGEDCPLCQRPILDVDTRGSFLRWPRSRGVCEEGILRIGPEPRARSDPPYVPQARRNHHVSYQNLHPPAPAVPRGGGVVFQCGHLVNEALNQPGITARGNAKALPQPRASRDQRGVQPGSGAPIKAQASCARK